jgi:phosphonate transport system substrate-binding protein
MKPFANLARFVLIGALAGILLGCGTSSSSTASGSEGSAPAKTELSIALVPSDDTEQMISSFEPVRAYLEKTLGMTVKMYKVTDYGSVIEALRGKRIDIAWLGPMSYILAEKEADAEAFAIGKHRNGAATYKALFVVPANSPAKTLADLKGKSAAFVEAASTSGGLVPTYIVNKEMHEMPEKFFGKFAYAGSHDAALLSLTSGTVDVAACNNTTYDRMLTQGKVKKDATRILVTSDDLPESPLAYRKDMDSALKKKISDAFLNAHKVLAKIDVVGFGDLEKFVPATAATFDGIRKMADELKLSRDQMLK